MMKYFSLAVLLNLVFFTSLTAQKPPVPTGFSDEPVVESQALQPVDSSAIEQPAGQLPKSVDSSIGVKQPSSSAVADVPAVTENIPKKKQANSVPPGQELVSIHFPDPTDMNDIVKAISIWMGKNVILDQSLNGKKVQIISPRKVTKEEAYQTFLSALNTLCYTTVETGKVMKVVAVPGCTRSRGSKGNFRTILGSDWTPRTDEVITQIIPLKYIDAKAIQLNLAKITNASNIIAYEPTNTLIVTDSGYKVKNILDIVKLLDVQGQQSQVAIVPIKYADAEDIAKKVSEIFGNPSSSSSSRVSASKKYFTYKIFTDERTNSVIVFGPPRTITDVKELVKKFDISLDDPSRQSSIHVRPLDYADATKIAATLNNLVTGKSSNTSARSRIIPRRSNLNNLRRGATRPSSMGDAETADLGEGVKITADESSNSLLITGSRSSYQAINALIRKLDVRKSQVFIESDIMDVVIDNDFKFGMSALLGKKPSGDGIFTPVGWQAGGGIANVIGSTATNSSGTAVNSNGAVGLASAFANDLTVGILSNVDVNFAGIGSITTGALINMIKTDKNTRSLSSPQILTSNNEEANITVGQERYFTLTGPQSPQTGIPTQRTEKVKAQLALTVKPNISHSNYVTMNITVDADTIGTVDQNGATLNIRKSSQIVTVKNKQTIVISGLTETNETDTVNKIPLLGDIPILGWLFRNTQKKKLKSNLMIFLTPYIVHGANDLADIYLSKRKSTDEFLHKVYGSKFKNTDFSQVIPTYEQGRYTEDPIDKLEEQRRSQMMKDLYNESSSKDLGRSDKSAISESTVPISSAIHSSSEPSHREDAMMPPIRERRPSVDQEDLDRETNDSVDPNQPVESFESYK